MPDRRIGIALALACLAAGAPALPAAETPEMTLAVKHGGEAGKGSVSVTIRAPLPDGTLVDVAVYRANAKPGENPLLQRRAETKGWAVLDEIPDPKGLLVPGDYRVVAKVADYENQPAELRQSRRLTPPLRRLQDEKPLKVGSRTAVTASINRLARRMLAQSEAIRRVYPAFADLLERAWAKKLNKGEWTQWGARPTLEKGREQMAALVADLGAGSYIPQSVGRSQSLLREIETVCLTIDTLLGDKIQADRNDNMIRSLGDGAKPGAGPASAIAHPSIRELNLTLYREGCAAYGSVAGQILKEVETAYESRAGKGAGNWSELASGWTKEIADQAKNFEEFDGLDFVVERGDLKVRLLEAFVQLKEHMDACGRVLKGESKDESASLAPKRDELRQRIDALRQIVP
jgi:hypothetical protein